MQGCSRPSKGEGEMAMVMPLLPKVSACGVFMTRKKLSLPPFPATFPMASATQTNLYLMMMSAAGGSKSLYRVGVCRGGLATDRL